LDSHSAAVAPEPFSARLRDYLKWSAALALLFAATYWTTNWLAAQRAGPYRLYFDWELAIPFIPWMIYPYLTVNGILLLPLFVLDRAGIQRFARAFAAATVAGAACHLLLPAALGWPRPSEVPGHPVFASLFKLDRPHNLVPSLHVAYSTLAARAVWRAPATAILKAATAVWLTLLIASVLLTHQHHLADVAAGLLLALALTL
jgi:hypothetical protein